MSFLVGSGRGFDLSALAEFATSAVNQVNQVASQVEKRIDRALDISEAENEAAARTMSSGDSSFLGSLLRTSTSSTMASGDTLSLIMPPPPASPVVKAADTPSPAATPPVTPLKQTNRSRGARGRTGNRTAPASPAIDASSQGISSPGLLIAEAPPPAIDSPLPPPRAVKATEETAPTTPEVAAQFDADPQPSPQLNTTAALASSSDELLTRRTEQIMKLTEENAALNDLVADLRASLEELRNAAETPIDSEAVAQLQAERDAARNELAALRSQTTAALTAKDELLGEKEDQVKQLLQEGEKLAKEQLKNSTTIKKLKVQEKENEAKIASLISQAEEHARKIAALQEELRLAERQKEAGVKAQQLSDAAAKRVTELELQLRDSRAKETTLQASLQKAWDEAAEARKEAATSTMAAQTEALERARRTQQELEDKLAAQAQAHEETLASYRKELLELRSSLSRAEDQAAWRQDQLTQEMRVLQERLMQAEMRATELAAATEEAARPLLRQIDALQAQALASNRNWQLAEESLTVQLRAANEDKNAAIEREGKLLALQKDLMARIAALETQVGDERKERTRLAAELERTTAEVSRLQAAVEEEQRRVESVRDAGAKALADAKDAHRRQLSQLAEEKQIAVETQLKEEQARVRDLETALERALSSAANSPATVMTTTISPTPSSYSGASNVAVSDLLLEGNSTEVAADFALDERLAAQTALIEKLRAVLRGKTAEADGLSAEVKLLISARDKVAEEAVRATQEATTAKAALERIPVLETALTDLNRRYAAALELLGERSEEVEALRSDLEDVKAMFRMQITELLDRVEVMSRQEVQATTAST